MVFLLLAEHWRELHSLRRPLLNLYEFVLIKNHKKIQRVILCTCSSICSRFPTQVSEHTSLYEQHVQRMQLPFLSKVFEQCLTNPFKTRYSQRKMAIVKTVYLSILRQR